VARGEAGAPTFDDVLAKVRRAGQLGWLRAALSEYSGDLQKEERLIQTQAAAQLRALDRLDRTIKSIARAFDLPTKSPGAFGVAPELVLSMDNIRRAVDELRQDVAAVKAARQQRMGMMTEIPASRSPGVRLGFIVVQLRTAVADAGEELSYRECAVLLSGIGIEGLRGRVGSVENQLKVAASRARKMRDPDWDVFPPPEARAPHARTRGRNQGRR
jgi:hypothetical protein